MARAEGLREFGRGALRLWRPADAPLAGGRNGELGLATTLPSLRPGDAERGGELLAGRFAHAGGRIAVENIADTWAGAPVSPAHDAWLHGFSWLQDLIAADADTGPAVARALVDAWLEKHSHPDPRAWSAPIAARRTLCWLAAAGALFDDADPDAGSRLRALVKHAAHLEASGRNAPEGRARFDRAIAMASAGACLIGRERLLEAGLEACAAEAERQILPDGGHASRSPQAVAEILADLHALDEALLARGLDMPADLRRGVDRMAPMLRFFLKSDGGLAAFQGGGAGDRAMLAAVSARDEAQGRAFGFAPHSGYYRVEAGGDALIIDVGAPASGAYAGQSHASALAFEFSPAAGPLIVNCGWSAHQPERLREAVRATAAHSTLTLADASSAPLCDSAKREPSHGAKPARQGVSARRSDEERGVWIEASHEGYRAAYGLVHRRRVFVAADGGDVRGEDTLFRPIDDTPDAEERPVGYAIRFHLHPSVKAALARDGRSVFLTLPDGEGWSFRTDCGPLSIERSIHLAEDGPPADARQIVVTGVARPSAAIDRPPNRARWALKRLGRAPAA